MRRQPYDLLAIDLDGTLLNSNHSVSPENRAALHRAHEAGLHIVLCTGRAYVETLPVVHEIGLDLNATITVFGAVITDVDSGRTLERSPVPRETSREVLAWLQERGYTVLWLIDRDQAGFDGYVVSGPRRHSAVDGYMQLSPCEMESVARLPDQASDPLRISIIDDRPVLEPVSAELEAAFAGRLTHNVLVAPTWNLTVIEAFAPQVNKWYGLQKLCERWRIDPARTVAVGDDVNDIEMIRHAGLGVAMANARDSVKAVADRLTTGHNEAGVARLIDELLSP